MTQIIELPDGRRAGYQVTGDGIIPALTLPGGPGFKAGYLARPDEPGMQERLAAVSGVLKTNLAAVQEWGSSIFPTFDLRPLLSSVSSPALIIAGEYDFICSPAQARPIAQGTPGSQLVILQDCGHLPVLESPGEYQQAVLQFLRDLA